MALTKITPQMFDTSATVHDLNVDNGTFVVDGSASRVGIGTATPGALLDVNGALTVSGDLTVDTNTLKVESSNNRVLIGKSSTGLGNAGVEFEGGQIKGTSANQIVQYLNRTSSDGAIIELRKDNTAVGVVGTVDGDLNVYASASGHKGLRFGNGYIAPTSNSTAVEDNTVDLGLSSYKFKDGYFAGNITGTLTTAAQTNITSVGTLTGLTTSGNISVTGQGDFSTQILVGNNNSHFSENNLRFQSAGHAYIDHNTTGQHIIFRTSNSSSLDQTVLTLSRTGDTTVHGLLYLIDGSNSSPALTFSNDNDTGILRVTTNALGIVAAGSRKFYVNATNAYFQNLTQVQIDSADFLVTGNITNTGTVMATDSAAWDTQTNMQLALRDADNTNMRANFMVDKALNSNRGGLAIQATESGVTNDRDLVLQPHGGRVGILTAYPNSSYGLDVNTTSRFVHNLTAEGNIITADVKARTSGGLSLQTDEGTKRLFIKDNGDVKVGQLAVTSATSAPLHVAKANTDVQAVFGDNNSSIDDPQIRIIGRNTANSTARYTYAGLDADNNYGKIGYNAGAGVFKDAIRMTSEGYVLKPNQPAFRVDQTYLSGRGTGYYLVDFSDTQTNCFDTGNNFNNNIFTAPVDGVYFFACSVRVDSTSGYFRVYISKNNSTDTNTNLHAIVGDGLSSNYENLQVSGTLYLSETDTARVLIYSNTDSSWQSQGEGHFSGFLVG